MTAQPHAGMTVEEYLAFERASAEKHEYRDGEIVAMAGASYAHNLLVMNTGASLHTQLRGRPCRVLPSDLRVYIPASHLFTYPDLTVVCGQPHFSDDRQDTLLNPQVIIEVLSPSTEGYDRGAKFRHYRTIESLREYVLIEQDSYRVEHFARQANDLWLLSDAIGTEATLRLSTLDCTIPLAEVYEEVPIEGEAGGDA